jgi:broad specificity phosphatase PhoE
MAVDIFIARHGQNEDNVNGVLNGHRDLPLTQLGRDQARQLGQGIMDAGLQFDVIYASPLSRAYETAEIVSKILGHEEKPKVLDLLIERDFGVMAGKPTAEIAKLCGPDIVVTDTITYFLCPEGAETFPQLVERGHEIIKEVNRQQKSGRVLLVCHGDIGKMTYAAATGRGWKNVLTDFHFGNGELIELSPNGKAHVIELEQHNL